MTSYRFTLGSLESHGLRREEVGLRDGAFVLPFQKVKSEPALGIRHRLLGVPAKLFRLLYHRTDCVREAAALDSVHNDRGYCYLALQRLATGFVKHNR